MKDAMFEKQTVQPYENFTTIESFCESLSLERKNVLNVETISSKH